MEFQKKLKISKNLENLENHKIYPNFPGTAELTLLEDLNSRIAPQFSFSLNFIGEIQMDETVKNELNTLNKKAPKITNKSIFFGLPTSITLSSYRSRLYKSILKITKFCRISRELASSLSSSE